MDVVKLLAGTPFEPVAKQLAVEFEQVGLTPETLHNAPLVVKTTHGADIYEIIQIIQDRLVEQAKTPKPAKRSKTKLED